MVKAVFASGGANIRKTRTSAYATKIKQANTWMGDSRARNLLSLPARNFEQPTVCSYPMRRLDILHLNHGHFLWPSFALFVQHMFASQYYTNTTGRETQKAHCTCCLSINLIHDLLVRPPTDIVPELIMYCQGIFLIVPVRPELLLMFDMIVIHNLCCFEAWKI